MNKRLFLLIFLASLFLSSTNGQDSQDLILGKWMSNANDLKVEVYKNNGEYKAKIIWFACYNGKQMSDFNDKNNPNPSLRSHPWLGLEVLNNLTFNGNNEWNNGNIYDPNSGHTFSSVCRLKDNNTLLVKGYWLYEWIGKTLTFYRVNK